MSAAVNPSRVVSICDAGPTLTQITSALGLQNEFELVEVLDDKEHLSRDLTEAEAEIILIDHQLGGQSTLDIIDDLAQQFPDTVIVAIVPIDKPMNAQQVTLSGARGFLIQPFTQVNLLSTLRRVRVLNARLPPETTVTTGAGNASDWPNIHYDYRQFLGALAPVSGAMGMGVPAAVAARIARPNAPAVYIGGDGDFLMNGQELATAVHYGLDPVFIIVDNRTYGTIRSHQERKYPGRISGTGLHSPDFATVAQGYGAHGERVASTAEFAPALERALASGKASVIHLAVGPDHLGPNNTVSSPGD